MILNEGMTEKVVEVIIKSYRIILVRVILEEKVLNIVGTYDSQLGCEKIRNKSSA